VLLVRELPPALDDRQAAPHHLLSRLCVTVPMVFRRALRVPRSVTRCCRLVALKRARQKASITLRSPAHPLLSPFSVLSSGATTMSGSTSPTARRKAAEAAMGQGTDMDVSPNLQSLFQDDEVRRSMRHDAISKEVPGPYAIERGHKHSVPTRLSTRIAAVHMKHTREGGLPRLELS
jgi:hypothetical protein